MKKKVMSYSVDYLQILDEKGKVDKKIEPKLKKDVLLKMYRHMVLSRLFDQKCIKMQRAGRMGTFAPITGQEAAQVGAMYALDAKDWVVPSFREAAALIVRGAPLTEIATSIMGFHGGRMDTSSRNLPVAVPVASQTLHATGIGMAMNILKKKHCAVSYCGDGATSQGDFLEALNFAGVYNAPVVFIVQNNHYAISLPRSAQTAAQTLAQKACHAGFEGVQVDGNDVLGMYVAVTAAAKKAKSGKGPTLIEAVTYRMEMHTTADDPKKYRSDKEVDAWRKKDPIDRFKKYLIGKKIWTLAKDKKLVEELTLEVDTAMQEAEKEVAKVEDMFAYVYAEMPAQLEEQLSIAKKYAGVSSSDEKDESSTKEAGATGSAQQGASDSGEADAPDAKSDDGGRTNSIENETDSKEAESETDDVKKSEHVEEIEEEK